MKMLTLWACLDGGAPPMTDPTTPAALAWKKAWKSHDASPQADTAQRPEAARRPSES